MYALMQSELLYLFDQIRIFPTCVCDQQDTSYPEATRAPVVHLVRRHCDNFVCARVRLWVTWEESLEFPGLPLDQLLFGEARLFSVGYPPQTIVLDLGRHEVVLGMDNKVCIFPTELVEWVISLSRQRHAWKSVECAVLTFVATICLSHVNPGKSLPKRPLRTADVAPSHPTI